MTRFIPTTFTVQASTNEELIEAAEAEIHRFYGIVPNHLTFSITAEARAVAGDKRGILYTATVRTFA